MSSMVLNPLPIPVPPAAKHIAGKYYVSTIYKVTIFNTLEEARKFIDKTNGVIMFGQYVVADIF